MSEETKVIEQPNSCKIAVNSKGVYSGEVKVYAGFIENAMHEAILRAKELEELIAQKNGLVKPAVK